MMEPLVTAIMWFAVCFVLLGQTILLVVVHKGLGPPVPLVTVNVVAGSVEDVVQSGAIEAVNHSVSP